MSVYATMNMNNGRSFAYKRLFDITFSVGRLHTQLCGPFRLMLKHQATKQRPVNGALSWFQPALLSLGTPQARVACSLSPTAARCRTADPIRKFLHASSLDELPELWNVLKGEMSLVGPRPLLMQYLPLYTWEQARRHEVRPGMMGWAQVGERPLCVPGRVFQKSAILWM